MNTTEIEISIERSNTDSFATILQHGVLIQTHAALPFVDIIMSLPGFSMEYIQRSVQTIFINGVAIDTLDQLVFPGSKLALSAAMPGLAGAIFRREGMHGSLRSKQNTKKHEQKHDDSYITIKLFNSIAIDRAFDIFSKGALLNSKSLHDFFQRRMDIFDRCKAILINETPCLTFEILMQSITNSPQVFLRIKH